MLTPTRLLVCAREALRRRPDRTALSVAVGLMVCLPTLVASSALAEGNQYGSIGQYGEVVRFGGFDSTWYNHGAYNGEGGSPNETEPAPGLFLDPVGFAVDSEDASVPAEDKCASGADENAIWVLDRTDETESETSWRLQKLDDCGEVLGSTSFTLPYVEETASFVEGLAVDQKTETIYALVIHREEQPTETSVPQEILDWSIKPSSEDNTSGKKELVKPSAATADSFTKATGGNEKPGVLAGEKTLEGTTKSSLGSLLYKPQGIAIDDTTSGQYVALEATTEPVQLAGYAPAGPTVVQQVSQTTGALGAYWDSKTGLEGHDGGALDGLAHACTGSGAPIEKCPEEEGAYGPAGLSTNVETGGLTVLLNPDQVEGGENTPYNTDVVSLEASLENAKILSSELLSQDPKALANWDGAAIEEFEAPFMQAQAKDSHAHEPSSPIVALSNGLYAAMFYNGDGGGTDSQAPGKPPDYWTPGGSGGALNFGVRLLDPSRESEGTLSNPVEPLTSVFDTLGHATGLEADPTPPVTTANACNINAVASLAAGSNGTVWVLTRGEDSSQEGSLAGRQVIELAPKASTPCPSPEGTFTIEEAGGSPQKASPTTQIVIKEGAKVTFDAEAINYEKGTPYAYEWSQTSETSSTPQVIEESVMQEPEYKWPSSKAEFTYKEPGPYTVELKLIGDYGEYDESGLIDVQSAGKPTAAFTESPETVKVGEKVNFNASGSAPAGKAEIEKYIWNFGDGHTEETQSKTETHSYKAAGTYTVTLTVKDRDGQESEKPASHSVTVTPEETITTTTSSVATKTQTSTTTSQPTTTSTTTTTTSTKTTKATIKTESKAQKLAKALKKCKKDKSKKQRLSCEKQAKKKYGPSKKTKTEKASKKGKKGKRVSRRPLSSLLTSMRALALFEL